MTLLIAAFYNGKKTKGLMFKVSISLIIAILGTAAFVLFHPPLSSAAIKIRVVAEQANVRIRPDIGSPIITHLPQGTTLDSQGKEGDWFRVKVQSEEGETVTGYIHESLVIPLEDIPPAEEKTEKRVVSPEKKEQPKVKFYVEERRRALSPGLSFTAGANYMSAGELNDGAKGLGQFFSDNLGKEGEGEVAPLHLSYIIGADFVIPLSSSLFFSLGADSFFGQKESQVAFASDPKATYTTRPRIQALPLRLTLGIYPFSFLYIRAGVEYYFARCRYFYRFERGDYWKEWQGNADSHGLGFLGAFGLEWKLVANLAAVFEVFGRTARIRGFKGTDLSRDSSGLMHSEEGKLYSFEVRTSPGDSAQLLFIRSSPPSEAGVLNAREAEVNLSGIALRAGFKIRF